MALSFFDKIKKAVSDAIDSVSQILPDTSHLKWEDRVKLYESLESVDGYVEALRLIDFHKPEDICLVDKWSSALAKHPEYAFDIYDRVFITNKIEIWQKIHKIHEEALKTATSDQQKVIKM